MTLIPLPAMIDSHIHLYTSSHLHTLRWAPSLPLTHVLQRQNSVQEYRSASSDVQANLRGFIFIESDRFSALSEDKWGHALDEVEFLARIVQDELRGEGSHQASGGGMVLGIVPWAPVPAGAKTLQRYMSLAKERCGNAEVWKKVKGVRYLVQDKPSSVMLQPGFITSLKWLGEQGLTFDLGVDARSGGMWQLREACEMFKLVYGDNREGCKENTKLKVMINHLCKPNLQLSPQEIGSGHPEYEEWKSCIEEMANFKGTFMKLSGAFSELPPSQDWKDAGCLEKVIGVLKPWTDVILDAFGPSRTMFGSDWPVCNVGGPGVELSWQCWHDVVEGILCGWNLSDDEKVMVWAGTAQLAYSVP